VWDEFFVEEIFPTPLTGENSGHIPAHHDIITIDDCEVSNLEEVQSSVPFTEPTPLMCGMSAL